MSVGAPDGDSVTLADELGLRAVGHYVLERPLGSGGMGVVFAGRDLRSERPVAIKLMRGKGEAGPEAGRFEREIRALSGLRHPGIVEYIDHGVAPDGRRYLVMERLQGEDLQQRLQRGALELGDSLELGVRLADALTVAHAQTIVHRDIKPSNIYLSAGTAAGAKLLDFGVARIRREVESLTRTGTMVGTLGYMAPEQARGEGQVDGRADLFSLGCVLHECITGEPVFEGDNAMAVLVKILIDEAPRLRNVRPDVPAALDELVAALLAKRVGDRPQSAQEVATTLAAMVRDPPRASRRRGRKAGVTLRERRVFCLLLVWLHEVAIDPLSTTDPEHAALPPELGQIAAEHGAEFSPVLGGAGMISVRVDAPPGDVAVMSARCARAVLQRFPQAALVLTTGRGERSGRSIVGAVIDDAAALEAVARPGAVLIDANTENWLAERFVLERAGEAVLLGGEREGHGVRMFLGKPGPFLGRARELAWLVGLYREVGEDGRSCAALVTAGPGAGKSRLRFEFARTLASEATCPLVLIGRGSPMTSGSALGLLRGALREEARIAETDEPEAQRSKARQRFGERVAPEERARVVAFLGETIGVHFDEAEHAALASARRDPAVMADSIRVAWLDWLRAECEARPVVLILEDLHWGDAASVILVGAALAALGELPLFVLALGRPELRAEFPELWSGARLHPLELPRISERASETLVRQALGDALEPARVRALIARADGNPLFLEELIRVASAGGSDELPETVLGVVQARLDAVDDESRRILRAASVYGGEFSEAGLCAVLGKRSSSLRGRLLELTRKELITADGSRAAACYRFHHALLRDAAYTMLTTEDQQLAHRLAADWLARQEGCEPMVVAEHLLRGGAAGQAGEWYYRAAEQSLGGGDMNAAVARAEQAIACGVTGALRGDVRLVQAEARIWAGSLDEAARWAAEAAEALVPGTSRWFAAIQRCIYCASVRGDLEPALEWLHRAEAARVRSSAQWGSLLCMCEMVYAGHVAGRLDRFAALIERIEARVAGESVPIEVLGHVSRARTLAFRFAGRLDRAVAAASEAAGQFMAVGDLRNASRVRVWEGHALGQLGDYAQAERVLRAGVEIAGRIGAVQTLVIAEGTLGDMLLGLGRVEEARPLITEALGRNVHRGDRRADGALNLGLGWAEALSGRLAEGEALVRRGLASIAGQPTFEARGRTILAKICAASGRGAEAVEQARQAATYARGLPGLVDYGCQVWWAIAECLEAGGAVAEAQAAVLAGVEHIRTVVGYTEDARLRRSVLAMPASRALLGRARGFGVEVGELEAMIGEA